MGRKNKKKEKTSNEATTPNTRDDVDNRIMKFAPKGASGGKQKYHPFASVRDHVAMEIQKTCDDGKYLARALKNGKHFDVDSKLPTEKQSTLSDPDDRKAEQRRLSKLYDIDLKE